MQGWKKLPEHQWTPGNRAIELRNLVPGMRCREIVLPFNLTGTKGAAETLDGERFFESVDHVKLGNYVLIQGRDLWELMKQVYGRKVYDPADVPGSGTTFTLDFQLRIPFRDPRQPASDDGSLPTELLRDLQVDVNYKAGAYYGGTILITAGTCKPMAEQVNETNIPQLAEIGYVQPGAQTYTLPGGHIYKDVFVTKGEVGAWGAITRANISQIDAKVDGQPVWDLASHDMVLAAYNGQVPRDSTGELTPNAASRFPAVWHDSFGKSNLSKQPGAEHGLEVQLTGDLVNPRFVYWRTKSKSNDDVTTIAAVTGAPPNATEYEPATVSKKTPRAIARGRAMGRSTKKGRLLSRHLPGKVRAPGDGNTPGAL